MLEDTLFENSELKKKIEKLEDKIRKQEDKIKSLETAKDKYKREAAAAKGLKVREGISKTSEISWTFFYPKTILMKTVRWNTAQLEQSMEWKTRMSRILLPCVQNIASI